MLSSKQRLPRRQVEYILRKGFQTRSKLFITRYKPNNQTQNRFCVIVSKKVFKNAVDRNYLRRKIYEALRANEKQFLLNNSNLDCIIIAKQNSKSLPYKEIEEGIQQLLTKITK